MIDDAAVGMMKPGATLINTGRGGLVVGWCRLTSNFNVSRLSVLGLSA
jgi:hypothetical protein